MRTPLLLVPAFLLALAVVGAHRPAQDRSGRPVTIGVLSHSSVPEPALDGFKAGMAELGYREGETIRYLYEGAVAGPDKLEAVALGLLDRRVDLLLGLSTPATQAAQRAAQRLAQQAPARAWVPIVFAPASDPVGNGLVQSLGRPGGTTTGVAFGAQEPRRLEWLKRLVPGARRVYVIYNPADPSPSLALAKLREPAAKLKLELVLREAGSRAAVRAALAEVPPDVDALFLPPDALVAEETSYFIAVSLDRRLPLSVPHRLAVRQGATFAFAFDLFQLGRQAARLADQILRGADPAGLPVETAEFRLSINLESAAGIGLAVPDDILRQAEVFPGRGS